MLDFREQDLMDYVVVPSDPVWKDVLTPQAAAHVGNVVPPEVFLAPAAESNDFDLDNESRFALWFST